MATSKNFLLGAGGSDESFVPEESRVDKKETYSNYIPAGALKVAEQHARDAKPILEAVLACRFSQKENQEVFEQLLGGTAKQLIQAHSTNMLVMALSGFLISNSIRYHHDLAQSVPEWLNILVSTTESAGGSIYIYDDDLGELYLRCTTGQQAHPVRIKKGTGLVGACFSQRKSIIQNNDESYDSTDGMIRDQMVCPMRLALSVVGVVAEKLRKK